MSPSSANEMKEDVGRDAPQSLVRLCERVLRTPRDASRFVRATTCSVVMSSGRTSSLICRRCRSSVGSGTKVLRGWINGVLLCRNIGALERAANELAPLTKDQVDDKFEVIKVDYRKGEAMSPNNNGRTAERGYPASACPLAES